MYNTFSKEKRLEEIDLLLERKTKALEDLKGKRKVTEIRNELKNDILDLSKEKRTLSKFIKEVKKMNIDKVMNIDSLIYKESLDRVFEQNMVLETMKQKALDCHLLKDYHENGGETIQCI
jgi:ribosomal protein S18